MSTDIADNVFKSEHAATFTLQVDYQLSKENGSHHEVQRFTKGNENPFPNNLWDNNWWWTITPSRTSKASKVSLHTVGSHASMFCFLRYISIQIREHHVPGKGGLPCHHRQKKKATNSDSSPHSIKETKTFFASSTRMVKTSRPLKKDYGILPVVHPLPTISKGRVITSAEKEAVYAFYESDEVSGHCPGQKDYKSVRDKETGVRERKQKTPCFWKSPWAIREDDAHPNIGFSTFCTLCPPDCVLAGRAGTHCLPSPSAGKGLVKRLAMAVDDDISTAERPDVGFHQHLGSFVACPYDSKLWIEVLEVYEENFNDFFVDFLHPNGINPSYRFPGKKDECHIKTEDVLGLLPPPNLHDGSRIQYKFNGAWAGTRTRYRTGTRPMGQGWY